MNQKQFVIELANLYVNSCLPNRVTAVFGRLIRSWILWRTTYDVLEFTKFVNIQSVFDIVHPEGDCIDDSIVNDIDKTSNDEKFLRKCHIAIIDRRKTIRAKISTSIIFSPQHSNIIFDQAECIKMLLVIENKNLKELEKLILLEQCSYLFRVERIIRLSNHLELISLHRNLLKTLKIENEYKNLFPTTDTTLLYSFMPRVLVNIVEKYCEFCWHVNANHDDVNRDEDELLSKLVLLG